MKNKIYFVVPPAFSHRTAEENLGVGYLASCLRNNGYVVEIVDAWITGMSMEELLTRMEGIVETDSENILYVGISTYVSCLEKVGEIIATIKKNKNIPVVAGGFGPSFFAEEFLDVGVDIISYGEGELTSLALCKYFEGKESIDNIKGVSYRVNGNTISNMPHELIERLDDIPFPARDTVDVVVGRKSSVNILSARGCKGNCSFCSVVAFYKLTKGKIWRQRSIKNFVDEIEELYNCGVDFFKVIDDSFLEKPRDEQWCKELSEEIKKRNIVARFRASIVAEYVTDGAIRYLKDAGFFSFACGIESFSDSVLRRYGKRATAEDNKRAIEIFYKYDIYVQCGFILFDPYTTIEELEENLEGFKKYSYILCKGIFTELYAAEGTQFTNKLLLDKNTGELKRNNENYKYLVKDEKSRLVYDSLKKWHKSYGNFYDMLIDPLTAPKNISSANMREIYECYLKVRQNDIQFMSDVIEWVKNKEGEIDERVNIRISNNLSEICRIEERIKDVYARAGLEYDGNVNVYI